MSEAQADDIIQRFQAVAGEHEYAVSHNICPSPSTETRLVVLRSIIRAALIAYEAPRE